MKEYRFEDLEIGMSESFTVEITEKMVNDFLCDIDDTNPLHTDSKFAKEQGYQDRVVYGMLTNALLSKLVGVYLPGKYCLLQGVESEFKKPVYIGDVLTVTGTVEELHPSVKRMSVKAVITNQNNKKVVRSKIEVGFLKYGE
ncbi:MAG: MaoC family dehydratase [Erysipelotrichaceae bacterium]|nr:MaoC family dehydratase [Erysipelotrichaceae bacterium]